MRISWRWAAVPALAGFALSLSGATLAGTTVKAHATGAQTFTVNVDGVNKKANESFLAYYPSATTVHAGDTVVFHYVGVGEPHTVTFGALVDKAVSDYAKLTPAQQQGTPPPAVLAADAALPQLFPKGPGDVIASAADKCFLASGKPGNALCPSSKQAQPDFNGTQSYYNSGWLDANQKFSVHLSSSTPPGTYQFMCLLHREFMSGKVTVVAAGKTVASPAAQFAAGQAQQAKVEAALAPAVAALRQGKPPVPHVTLPGSNPALAGSAGNVPAQIDEFGPKTIKIPVGGSVTWYLLGDHSITFNSNKTDNDIRANAPDGTAHLNPKGLAPAGGPGEPPPGKPAFTTGIHFQVVASQSWNGKGFHSSGVFVNSFGPPVIEGYKLKFTTAGTYNYICTVHDRMKGTVVVGGG
jgi:plastocyanin